jgi:hypothetical protein
LCFFLLPVGVAVLKEASKASPAMVNCLRPMFADCAKVSVVEVGLVECQVDVDVTKATVCEVNC